MAIDININNQNKHWILVVLSKIKEVSLLLLGFIVTCIKFLGRFIKRIWKILVGLAALIMIVIGCIWGYDYYNNVYLPEKLLNEAVADIESKFNSKDDSIKCEYAYNILLTDYDWKYENVSNDELYLGIAYLSDDAFKYIESKAYEGNAKCQYRLGQLYSHKNNTIENNLEKAVYWWNEAAQQDYIQAFNNLGVAYKDGIGVNQDLRKAVEYLKRGAEAGEDWAQRNYGDLFVQGVSVKVGSHKETKKTTGYCNGEKISEYYDYKTMDFIRVYRVEVDDYEEIIPKDITQAQKWWKKAAAQGNEVAKERLQKIYE